MEEGPQVPASITERYRVGRMIGDGNFAVVRECVERSTGREYALKIINKGKCRGKVRDADRNIQPGNVSRYAPVVIRLNLVHDTILASQLNSESKSGRKIK